MGPYRGGQAQYIKVPYADFNALKLPPGTKHESDFIVRLRRILLRMELRFSDQIDSSWRIFSPPAGTA